MIKLQDRENLPLDGSDNGAGMTCEEFQDQIPELMSGDPGLVYGHEHLKSCKRCPALIEELEYIAEIAKRLHEGYEPSDTLWPRISESIDHGENGRH